LVVGEWNVRLRGPCWMDVSRLFPTVIDNTEMKESNTIEGWNVIPIRRRLWGTTLDCRLSMAEDGTFVLMPHTTTSKTGGEIEGGPRRQITTSSQQQQPQQQLSSIMPLRGEWKVSSNPYCVTDRYYDQLSLQSYPRTLQQLHESSPLLPANIQIQDESPHVRSSHVKVPTCNTTTVTTIDFTLHGRLWGLYDRPRQPRRQRIGTTIPSSSNNDDDYDVTNNTIATAVTHAPKLYGRITHGTLVLRRRRRQQQPQQQWHRQSCTTDQKDGDSRSTSNHRYHYYRPIIASFSAQRSSMDPSHDGWIDQAYFGY
jgi:hypothetical protein